MQLTREALIAIAVGGSAHASLTIEAERGDVGVGEAGTLIDGEAARAVGADEEPGRACREGCDV